MKTALVVVIVLIVAALTLHLYVKYNAGKMVERLVRTHSKGSFTLKQERLRINYATLMLELDNVMLKELDTTGTKVVFSLESPRVRFQLRSIWAFLSRRSLEVSNFHIDAPHFVVRKRPNERKDAFKASGDVYQYIQKFVESLKVKQFLIEDGSFDILPEEGDKPLYHFGDIRFAIANMSIDSSANARKDQAFYSDNISLRMKNEHIVFLDSAREVRFTNLFLSSREKILVIDSVAYNTFSTEGSDTTKTRFNVFLPSLRCINTDYAGLYNDKVIRIDTVECEFPEIIAAFRIQKKEKQPELKVLLQRIVQKLFGDVDVKYFRLKHAKLNLLAQTQAGSRSIEIRDNDIVVNNLTVLGQDTAGLSIGSIRFAIKDYASISPEKGYRLNMDEFLINENSTVSVTNLTLYPSADGGRANANRISVPSITLENLDLAELLLEKRIVAGRMILKSPMIEYSLSGSARKRRSADLFSSLGTYEKIADVDALVITHGNVCLTLPRQKMVACLYDLNINVSINTALEARNYYGLLRAADSISFNRATVQSPQLKAELVNGSFAGATNTVSAERTRLQMQKEGVDARINGFQVRGLVFDDSTGRTLLYMDSLSWKSAHLDVEKNLAQKKPSEGPTNITIHAGLVSLPNTSVSEFSAGKWTVRAPMLDLYTHDLHLENQKLSFSDLRVRGKNFSADAGNQLLSMNGFNIAGKSLSSISGLKYIKTGTDSLSIAIPGLSFRANFDQMKQQVIGFDVLEINRPDVFMGPPSKDSSRSDSSALWCIHIDQLLVNEGDLEMQLKNGSDVVVKKLDVDASRLRLVSNNLRQSDLAGLALKSADIKFRKGDSVQLLAHNLTFNMGDSAGLGAKSIALIRPGVSIGVKDITAPMKKVVLDELRRGNWKNALMAAAPGLNARELLFEDSLSSVYAGNLHSDNLSESVSIDSFHYLPRIPRDSFMKTQLFETDYVEKVGVRQLTVQGLDMRRLLYDSTLAVRSMGVDGLDLRIFRDKNLPDQTGKYKGLPQTLLRRNTRRFTIDTVKFDDGYVAYTEVSEKTKLPATFFFTNLNGSLVNVKTWHFVSDDTLQVLANAKLLGSADLSLGIWAPISDTMASFRTSIRAAPFSMDTLNSVITPMSNARVTSGQVDTIYLDADANDQYAAGKMMFRYRDLHVKLGDETKGRSFMEKFMTFVADRLILRHRNEKRVGAVFFRRNQEKFIFNYLVKIAVSGFLSSTGVKSNKRYLKLLEKEKELLRK